MRPAGSSRMRVRGFSASSWRSMMRLSDIAAVRAPTAATAISPQHAAVSGWATTLNTPARISGREKSVCSNRTNEAYVRRRPGAARAGGAVVMSRRVSHEGLARRASLVGPLKAHQRPAGLAHAAGLCWYSRPMHPPCLRPPALAALALVMVASVASAADAPRLHGIPTHVRAGTDVKITWTGLGPEAHEAELELSLA